MVLGSLDQAKVLSQTGLKLAGAEAFFVGNPVTAKKAFAMNAVVGGELPMRLSVWAGKGGTEIGYFQPSDLLAAMSPQMGKMVGPMMDKALGGIAAQVAAG